MPFFYEREINEKMKIWTYTTKERPPTEWMKGIKDNFNDLFKKLASRIR